MAPIITTVQMAMSMENAYTICSNGSSEKKAIINIITVANAKIRMQKSFVYLYIHI